MAVQSEEPVSLSGEEQPDIDTGNLTLHSDDLKISEVRNNQRTKHTFW